MAKLRDLEAEIARRRLAKLSFVDFVRYIMGPKYLECDFTLRLCAIIQDFIERVENGESPRVMISAPPRMGKSQHVTRMMGPWFLGRNPKKEVIGITHSQTLADKNGGDVRELLNDPRYRDLFEIEVDKSFNAKDFVKLVGGKNSFVSTSVEAGLPGLGADCMVIDDYHKGSEDADSQVIRDKIWEWWSGTASNRIMAGGGVLVTATRWHVDDLQGRMLNSPTKWEIHRFPAIVDEEKKISLHPALMPWGDLMIRKNDSTERHWHALYLCQPFLSSGNFFRKDWINYYDPNEVKWSEMKTAIGADFATKAGEYNDHSGIVAGGIDHKGRVYVHPDIIYGKFSPAESVKRAVKLGKERSAQLISVEKGTIANMMEHMFRDEFQEQGHWMVEARYARTKSKDVHASGLAARMEKKTWFFPRTPWMTTTGERLLMQFSPDADGADDFIDALTSLEYAFRGSVKPPPPPLPDMPIVETIFEQRSRMFRDDLSARKKEEEPPDDW